MAKRTTAKGGWGRATEVIKSQELEAEIVRLTKAKAYVTDHPDRRRLFYFKDIKNWFDKKELTTKERNRVLEAGWTKVKEYAHALSRSEGSRQHFEKWTKFATRPRVTVEQVKQAAERGWPSIPEEDRVESFVLQLTPEVKQQLADALEQRGRRPYQRGRRGGGRDQWKEYGDSVPALGLLRDAAGERRRHVNQH